MGTREAVIMGDMNTECKPGSCVAALVPGAASAGACMARSTRRGTAFAAPLVQNAPFTS